MLRARRAIGWTSDTIDEIFKLGLKIYNDNIRMTDGRIVYPFDMVEPIRLGNSVYKIRSEPYVFGTVTSPGTNGSSLDLENGLKQFFMHYDSGHIQGPQSMAVWHELNHYYLFDAKERDALGRKWVEGSATQAAGGDASEEVGAACVSRFQQIDQLVAAYMANVPMKNRTDPYRIIHLELSSSPILSEQWFNWCSIAKDTWMLRGLFSQAHQRVFSTDDDRRGRQGTCMVAVALMLIDSPVKLEDWTSSTLDEILIMGDAYHAHSVQMLKDENRFIDYKLCASEMATSFVYDEVDYRIKIEDCLVNGTTVMPKDSNDTMKIDLKRGKVYTTYRYKTSFNEKGSENSN